MSKSYKLISFEVLRGAACLLVWLSHIRVATEYFKEPKFDFIQSFTAWGKESVAVFFILSGVVINLSTQNQSRSNYFVKRLIRIYPIYFLVLVICFLTDSFLFLHPVSLHVFVGNLFLSGTLQGYVAPTMPLNPAVWSISCEVFFYIIFGSIFRKNSLRNVWIWFVFCLISIVYKLYDSAYHTGVFYHIVFLLNNSFLWLLGYLVFEYRDRVNTSLPAAVFGILMIPMITRLQKLPDVLVDFTYYLAGIYLIPLFIYLLRKYDHSEQRKRIFVGHRVFIFIYLINLGLLWNFSASLNTNKLFYSIAPALSFLIYFAPVVSMINWIYKIAKWFFTFLAGISYSVYLIHMPVFYLIYFVMPTQKLFGMLLAIVVTIGISILFETFVYKNIAGRWKAYNQTTMK